MKIAISSSTLVKGVGHAVLLKLIMAFMFIPGWIMAIPIGIL
jgi:hypothetical protein